MAEPESSPSPDDQLAELADLIRLLDAEGVDYWLFGGWAVDFWVGAVTRSHGDIDLAVWLDDRDAIDAALQARGWRRTPVSDESVGAGYRQHGILTELTFVVADDDGRIFLPFAAQHVLWSTDPFGQPRRTLNGVDCRTIPLKLLLAGKSAPREDPDDAAKDRADYQALTRRQS
jgi:hypothetical protein